MNFQLKKLSDLSHHSIFTKSTEPFSQLLNEASPDLLYDLLDGYKEEAFPEFNAYYCIKQSGDDCLTDCLMALSPDDCYLISADSPDDLTIKIWNLQAKRIITSFTFNRENLQSYSTRISAITVTPDSKFILIALSDGHLYCYDLQTHTCFCLASATYPNIHKIVITDNLKHVILCAKNLNSSSIALLNLEDHTEYSHPIYHLEGITRNHTLMNGIFLGVSNNYCLIFDHTMRRIAVRRLCSHRLTHTPSPVLGVFIPTSMSKIDFCYIEEVNDITYLVAGSLYNGIFRWNLQTQELLSHNTDYAGNLDFYISNKIFTLNKEYIAYGDKRGIITICNLRNNMKILEIPTNLSLNNIIITNDHKYIIAIGIYRINLYSFTSGKLLNTFSLNRGRCPLSIISSQSNKIIVISCLNGDFLFLNLENNLKIKNLSIHQQYFLWYMHHNRSFSYEQLTDDEKSLFHSLPYKFQKIILESREKETRKNALFCK